MKQRLPEMFRPLMWSYRFEAIDPDDHRDELIVNTINYGSLRHWKWLIRYYGKPGVRSVLEKRWETELTPESRQLSRLIFGVRKFRYAPGSAD